jgi:chromosome segregation ATPase
MSMAMLQHVHDHAEDMGQASSLRAQLRDLQDDMELKEALITSVKESESRAGRELASLKEKFARMEEDLAKEKARTASLESEKFKLEEEVSGLKAKADEDNSALKLLQSELLGSASKFHEVQVELRETQE